ncbi:MAG: DUF6398 domain-containing protein [Deferrisomatales bacterium]
MANPKKSPGEPVPKAMQAVFEEVASLTDRFSAERLNPEYAVLCRAMAAALARKRPSPLSRGKPEVWAAGVVSAVGHVNFLSDRSTTPHVGPRELAAGFGVAESTAQTKGKQIRDLLRVGVMDPRWTLPSRLERNPMAWMVQVNGLIVDARALPRPLQEEAWRRGLIPCLPGTGGVGPGY